MNIFNHFVDNFEAYNLESLYNVFSCLNNEPNFEKIKNLVYYGVVLPFRITDLWEIPEFYLKDELHNTIYIWTLKQSISLETFEKELLIRRSLMIRAIELASKVLQ